MKTIRDILSEVKLLNTTSKKMGKAMLGAEQQRTVGNNPPKMNWSTDKKSYTRHGDTFHHVSTHSKTGHKIFVSHYGGTSEYHAHDPEHHGKIDISVTAHSRKHQNGTRTLKIATLSGREGSKLKAHQLYHHLITSPKHNAILRTDAQTHGGAAVWKKLGSHKGISVHGWHKGKPVNVTTSKHGKDDEDIYHQENKGPNDPKPDYAKPKELVASKMEKMK